MSLASKECTVTCSSVFSLTVDTAVPKPSFHIEACKSWLSHYTMNFAVKIIAKFLKTLTRNWHEHSNSVLCHFLKASSQRELVCLASISWRAIFLQSFHYVLKYYYIKCSISFHWDWICKLQTSFFSVETKGIHYKTQSALNCT